MTRFEDHVGRLRMPLVAAPMTLVSTVSLVAEACRAGVVGAFPTSNAKSISELDEWFDEVRAVSADTSGAHAPGPIAANLIVGRQNIRLDEDVACVVRHQPAFVITSVGSPAAVTPDLQRAGCLVLADVASVAHAHKALAVGVDGLVLLGAGAGGHTGWANPFAFVRAVRAFWDGPLVMAGGVADGDSVWAGQCAGYGLCMAGTRFIATHESGAGESWKSGLVSNSMDNVSITTAPNGVAASTLDDGSGSAGHTVSSVTELKSVSEVVDDFETGWLAAQERTRSLLP